MASPNSEILVIQHEADCPPGVLAEVLEEAGARLNLVRAHAGAQIPQDLRGLEGIVVLGGGMDADDDAGHPWLPEVRALLRSARDRRVPTLGICLGAQLAAIALEGDMARREEPEVGLHSLRLTAAGEQDPVLSAMRDPESDADADPDAASDPSATGESDPVVLQWHQDGISALPPSSTLLAEGPDGAIQAFVTDGVIWSVQFHPEITPGILERWARTSSLTPAGETPESLRARLESAQHHRAAWRRLLAAFVQVALRG